MNTSKTCHACGTEFETYCSACDNLSDLGFAADLATDRPAHVAPIVLASNCGCCGAKLTDALSQELGIGPVCREKHGYDKRDSAARTDWAATLSALGEGCPEEIYAVAVHARTLRDDEGGLKGGRELANALIRRLALCRSEMASDSITVRCSYVAALSALGYTTLALRCAQAGLGVEYAIVDQDPKGAKVTIMRGKRARTSFIYATVQAGVDACRAALALTIVGGWVFGKASPASEGDWYVNVETGESVRPAFPGEPARRPGLTKVVAWNYFARTMKGAA